MHSLTRYFYSPSKMLKYNPYLTQCDLDISTIFKLNIIIFLLVNNAEIINSKNRLWLVVGNRVVKKIQLAIGKVL